MLLQHNGNPVCPSAYHQPSAHSCQHKILEGDLKLCCYPHSSLFNFCSVFGIEKSHLFFPSETRSLVCSCLNGRMQKKQRSSRKSLRMWIQLCPSGSVRCLSHFSDSHIQDPLAQSSSPCPLEGCMRKQKGQRKFLLCIRGVQ